jgi:hypothetical protein
MPSSFDRLRGGGDYEIDSLPAIPIEPVGGAMPARYDATREIIRTV